MSGPASMTRPPRRSPSLGGLMILIAGGTVGFWLMLPMIRNVFGDSGTFDWKVGLRVAWLGSVGILGGLALVGPPILFAEGRRRRSRWGPGRFWWFVQGTATWLMWPPIVANRFRTVPAGQMRDTMTEICYVYGTPMMGLYVGLSLLAGGRRRRALRKHLGNDWPEQFGRLVGYLWAIVGLGVLIHLYLNDFGIVR